MDAKPTVYYHGSQVASGRANRITGQGLGSTPIADGTNRSLTLSVTIEPDAASEFQREPSPRPTLGSLVA